MRKVAKRFNLFLLIKKVHSYFIPQKKQTAHQQKTDLNNIKGSFNADIQVRIKYYVTQHWGY